MVDSVNMVGIFGTIEVVVIDEAIHLHRMFKTIDMNEKIDI